LCGPFRNFIGPAAYKKKIKCKHANEKERKKKTKKKKGRKKETLTNTEISYFHVYIRPALPKKCFVTAIDWLRYNIVDHRMPFSPNTRNDLGRVETKMLLDRSGRIS